MSTLKINMVVKSNQQLLLTNISKNETIMKRLNTDKVIQMAEYQGREKKNLHIVLNDQIMSSFESKCQEVGTSKSEAGRLLIQAFISGVINIEFPKMVPVNIKQPK